MLRCSLALRRTVQRSYCSRSASSGTKWLSESDGIVKFDVGGSCFTTLRSTASLSPTLTQHMAAAEQNPALTRDGAIFVDRDPEVFPVVLKHLQNTSAGE